MPGSCTPACDGFIPLSSCGDGDVDPGEQCDHGGANGSDGDACDPNCRFACGNGIQDVGETCDDGVNDGSYGGCESDCTPAGYCGDGVENGPEDCDRGDANEADPYGPGRCTTNCETAPMCGDGRTQSRYGEECDGQLPPSAMSCPSGSVVQPRVRPDFPPCIEYVCASSCLTNAQCEHCECSDPAIPDTCAPGEAIRLETSCGCLSTTCGAAP